MTKPQQVEESAIQPGRNTGQGTADLDGGARDGRDVPRYAFSTEELSTLLRLHASPPADSPLFAIAQMLSAKPYNTAIHESLRAQGVLDGEGKTTEAWSVIIESFTKPHWELSLLRHQWKDRTLRHHYFASPQGKHLFSGYFREGDDLHIIMVHSDLAALREALLRAFSSEIMPITGKVNMRMTFREFVALLGIIDLQRTSYLVSFLERSPSCSSDFSLSEVSYIMGKGLSTADPRWCVTLASIFSPQEISLSREHLEAALLDLEKRSLLSSSLREGEERIFRPAEELGELIMALREVSAMTALKAIARDALSRKAFALVVLQGPEGVLCVDMRGEGDDSTVHILTCSEREVSDCLTSLFRTIGITPGLSEEEKSFLEPPEEPGARERRIPLVFPEAEVKITQSDLKVRCQECGTENHREAFSCRECGSRLPSMERLKTCPGCQKQIRWESRFCRYCRFSFVEDEREASGEFEQSSIERGKGEAEVESQKESSREPAQGEKDSSGSDGKDAQCFRNVRLCPECAREVHRESPFCRFCGYDLSIKEELDG